MTDPHSNRHGRRGEAARGRQQESTRTRLGGSRVTDRGRVNGQEPSDPGGDQEEDFRDDTENKAAVPTYEDPISPKLKVELNAVCEEASAVLRTSDTEAARKFFRRRVKTQLRAFYHGSHESLYCLLLATYRIGNSLKRKYGRGRRTPMYKTIIGCIRLSKVYMRVLQGCISIPKEEPDRKTVQTRLSGYNCALEQAYREGLDEEQLLYRLSRDGGIDRLLREGRERRTKEKVEGRINKQTVAGEIAENDSDTAADQNDLFDREAAIPMASARGVSLSTGSHSRPAAQSIRRFAPLNASLEVEDDAYLTIARGRGRHVAIIDVAHTRPPHVTIKLAQILPHHDCDDDEQALDRMITSVRSSQSRK